MGPYVPRVALALRTPTNQRSAGGVGVSTPYRAVSTLGITVFIPVSSELWTFGKISDPGYKTIIPGWRWLHELKPISDQLRGIIDPGDHRLRHRFVGIVGE